MIVLDERNFLKKELEDKGFEIFDFYEGSQFVGMEEFSKFELKRRSEFLLVDTQTVLNNPDKIENFKTLLNTFLGAVFFHEHSNAKAQEWVQNEGAFLTKIIGEYALPMSQLSWTMVSNQLQFFWNLLEDQKKLQKHMALFSLELDEVLKNAEVEMVKAKKIHDSLIPRRSEEIKGLVFSNKYAAGDGGGEFFDLFQSNSKIYAVLVSSQSYLISSTVLGLLAKQKGKDFNSSTFLADAHKEIELINGAKKKKATSELLLLEIDPNSLQLNNLSEAKVELYSQKKGSVTLIKDKTHQLEKDEKVIVFSSGFLFNWSEKHPNKGIDTFLLDHKETSSSEFMSECFFQLKDGNDGQFLSKDATVVMLEVNRHGIHKV